MCHASYNQISQCADRAQDDFGILELFAKHCLRYLACHQLAKHPS